MQNVSVESNHITIFKLAELENLENETMSVIKCSEPR